MSCEAMLARANLGKPPNHRSLESLPPDWAEDYQKLSDLVHMLTDMFDGRIFFRFWDPRSLPGLLKCLRYSIRRYPSFVINHRMKINGWNIEDLMGAITRLKPVDGCYPKPVSEASQRGR